MPEKLVEELRKQLEAACDAYRARGMHPSEVASVLNDLAVIWYREPSK